MRQTERERVIELEAKSAFQRQTLRTIRVVAENAPPEEAQVALNAIGALASEALGEAEAHDHDHSSFR
jgi:uncharacterized coiled-coil protein SlyX